MRVDSKSNHEESGRVQQPYIAKQNNLVQRAGMTQQADIAQNTGMVQQDVLLEISNEARSCLVEMLQKSREDKEKSNDAMDDMAKAMEIARRISRGDYVPALDEKKLMEYSMELYQIAKQTSILNVHKKHKDWKSLYKEEEERERQRRLKQEMQQGSGTLESVAIESGAMGSSETSAMEGGAMESSAERSSIEEGQFA